MRGEATPQMLSFMPLWVFSVLTPLGGKRDFPGGSDCKASVYNEEDRGSIPGSGRFPGEGNGNPLQYSCLENPMDGGAWCRPLSMGSQSRARLSDFTSLGGKGVEIIMSTARGQTAQV